MFWTTTIQSCKLRTVMLAEISCTPFIPTNLVAGSYTTLPVSGYIVRPCKHPCGWDSSHRRLLLFAQSHKSHCRVLTCCPKIPNSFYHGTCLPTVVAGELESKSVILLRHSPHVDHQGNLDPISRFYSNQTRIHGLTGGFLQWSSKSCRISGSRKDGKPIFTATAGHRCHSF